MVLQNASIHHHEHSSLTRLFGRMFVDHVFLQPDCGNLQLNRLFHNLADKLGSPEYIHQIDFLCHFNRYFKQRRIRLFSKRLRDMRIYEGVTCSLELAFDYHSRLYVYEMQPDWYDEFLSVEDEIMALISDPEGMEEDDDEPLGGYFSKN